MSPSKINSITSLAALVVILSLVVGQSAEAKLLRRSRYYDDSIGSPYGDYQPMGGATGERAILTVRGTRNPYDGSAPSKIAIEDQPFRGPYPRGVYDRLDSGYNRRPMYPMSDYGYNGGFSSGFGGYSGYNNGFNSGMYGAPSRIAVTGAFPYGYGSRFGK